VRGIEVVRPEDAAEGLGQDRLEHVGAARRVDVKDGELRGPKTPRPELVATIFVSRLIHPEVGPGGRFGGVGRVAFQTRELILELLVVRSQLPDLLLELGIGLLQGKDLGAKQVVLQDQPGYRDILVCHRRGYTRLLSFALVETINFCKLFFDIL
jgi:hypothetical protein